MAKAFVFFLLSFLLLSLISSSTAFSRKLGETNQLKIYELKKGNFSVTVTNYGATILSVVLPDAHGKLGDVLLGYNGMSPYYNNTLYFGALVGRVANRIANARFVLNGKTYTLYPNDGKNTLHGGLRGFNANFWRLSKMGGGETPYVTFHYRSFDGEEGFPGALDVHVTYKITSNYKLSVHMKAKALNKATPVNLAQHSYWNLNGEGNGTILSHKIQICGSKVTPVYKDLIPTGKFTEVKNTPFDFLKPRVIGSRINEVEGGYDINYVIDGDMRKLRKVAVLTGSARKMELWANQPGLQFYTGNLLTIVQGKNGHVYRKYAGLALESQGFPNSVNQPGFPSQIVEPGKVYRHHMIYKFSF